MSQTINNNFVQQHPDVATALTLLDKWITQTVRDKHQPGLAAGIVYDGELIWSKGYGYANVEEKIPVTADTRFRIASITKTFTATAILQLRDAGKLGLDDPLSKHLTWFKLQYPGAPAITLRHLLTHTSGLPRDADIPHWTEDCFQPWGEVVAATQKREPVMPPGLEYKYSNLGYTLLGGVVEAVSGETWAGYLQTHILDPLAMRATIVTPKGEEPNLAIGYLSFDADFVRPAAPFVATNGFSPSASMASSVNDLAKYARFHLGLDNTGVLSPHTLRDMHRVHWLESNWQSGYGLGIGIYRIGEWTTSGHSGGYKGYLTQFRLFREQKVGIIILTNAMRSNSPQYVEQAAKLVLPPIIAATQKKPVADPAWQQYVGAYSSDWGENEVVIRDGQLQVLSLDFINDPPTILEPTSTPHVFTIKSSGEGGETARFEFDATGKIVRLWTNNEYSVPKR